jgi:hypothetical protein
MAKGNKALAKRPAVAVIVAAVMAAAAAAGCPAAAPPDAEKDAEYREAVLRRVETLEAGNRGLALDLAFMAARNGEAIRMAEELLVRTRLSYPMKSAEIIAELASYQAGLCALLEKLREIK